MTLKAFWEKKKYIHLIYFFVLADLYLLKHHKIKMQDSLVFNEQSNPSWEGMKLSTKNGVCSFLLFKVQISSPLLFTQKLTFGLVLLS